MVLERSAWQCRAWGAALTCSPHQGYLGPAAACLAVEFLALLSCTALGQCPLLPTETSTS